MRDLTGMIRKLKCTLGFHKWRDTGIRRMYGFIHTVECVYCGEITEMTPEDVFFGSIVGKDVMVIKK